MGRCGSAVRGSDSAPLPGAPARPWRREVPSANQEEPRLQERARQGGGKGRSCLPGPRRALGGAGRRRALSGVELSVARVRLVPCKEVLGEPRAPSERGPARCRPAAGPAVVTSGRLCPAPASSAVELLDRRKISAFVRPPL